MVIVSMVLSGLLLMTVIYIYHLKRSLVKTTEDIKDKRILDTNTLLTSNSNTKEVRNLIKEFNESVSYYREQEIQIERKNKQLQKTIVNISHDLRTPLTSAIGYLEMLQVYKMTDAKKQEYEEIVAGKLGELTDLIEDFFVFTKAIAKEEELVKEEIDINKIFEESIVSYYQDFTLQNREIHINGSQKIKMVSNERMIRRIFDNVIGNALWHSNGDVYININTVGKIEYVFTNTINEPIEVEHIFDEFYTSDISRTKQQTGLGLAIVKEFVEQLGGSVLSELDRNQLHIILSWPKDNKV